MGGPGVGEGKDSLERLLEDVDRAVAVADSRHCACGYYGKHDDECDGCPAFDDDDLCAELVIADVARRLHALGNGTECPGATATCDEVGGHGMKDGEDSLERLLKDMDAAASCGRLDAQKCDGCLAMEDAMACVRCAFGDAARRMHALMPHDADGREIEVGDTIESTFGTKVHVTDVIAMPVNAHDGVVDKFPISLPHLWRVVESDSWEKLEQDAAKRVCEYAGAQRSVTGEDRYNCIGCPYDEPGPHTDKGCQERMRLDLVRRAKALSKAGDGE